MSSTAKVPIQKHQLHFTSIKYTNGWSKSKMNYTIENLPESETEKHPPCTRTDQSPPKILHKHTPNKTWFHFAEHFVRTNDLHLFGPDPEGISFGLKWICHGDMFCSNPNSSCDLNIFSKRITNSHNTQYQQNEDCSTPQRRLLLLQ